MRILLLALIAVALCSCADEIVIPFDSTPSATLLWTSSTFDPRYTRLFISTQNNVIGAFLEGNHTSPPVDASHVMYDLAVGKYRESTFPPHARRLTYSADGSMCAYSDKTLVVIVNLATGARHRTLQLLCSEYEQFDFAWHNNSELIVCIPEATRWITREVPAFNYFEIPVDVTMPIAGKDLSALETIGYYGDRSYARWCSVDRFQFGVHAMLDPIVDTSFMYRAFNPDEFPHSSGTSRYSIREMELSLVDESENVEWSIPLASDGEGNILGFVEAGAIISGPRPSLSGRYVAMYWISLLAGPDSNYVVVVDTQTRKHVARIYLDSSETYLLDDVIFDPIDERTIYIANNGRISKWRF